MKISELISRLDAFKTEHGDLEIWTEGCDCDAPAGEVAVYGKVARINHQSFEAAK